MFHLLLIFPGVAVLETIWNLKKTFFWEHVWPICQCISNFAKLRASSQHWDIFQWKIEQRPGLNFFNLLDSHIFWKLSNLRPSSPPWDIFQCNFGKLRPTSEQVANIWEICLLRQLANIKLRQNCRHLRDLPMQFWQIEGNKRASIWEICQWSQTSRTLGTRVDFAAAP